ncbi:MAG: twin-arginine translocation signal domain-containing protein [Planctomycetota bacterium]
MKRRDFLKAASVSAAALAVPGCSYVQQRVVGGRKKPNIVYIMLDELAYFELSCMGNKYLADPQRIDDRPAYGPYDGAHQPGRSAIACRGRDGC